jgi:hypothetical protein
MDAKTMVRDFCATHAPRRDLCPASPTALEQRELREIAEDAEFLAATYGHQTEYLEGDAFRHVVRSPVYSGAPSTAMPAMCILCATVWPLRARLRPRAVIYENAP